MDLGKNQNISADYKDRRPGPQWELRLFAEVVFVDKGCHGLHPHIYQLKDTAIPSFEHIIHWRTNALKLPNESFSMLGEAAAFDRKKKQILLTNQNTITYNYLIVGSDNAQQIIFEDQKFMDAFHALIEALRLQQKMPFYFPLIKNLQFQKKGKSLFDSLNINSQSPSSIEQIAKPYICQTFDPNSLKTDLQSINKRLYEVHI